MKRLLLLCLALLMLVTASPATAEPLPKPVKGKLTYPFTVQARKLSLGGVFLNKKKTVKFRVLVRYKTYGYGDYTAITKVQVRSKNQAVWGVENAHFGVQNPTVAATGRNIASVSKLPKELVALNMVPDATRMSCVGSCQFFLTLTIGVTMASNETVELRAVIPSG